MDEIKCLDTYALIEIYLGNENFLKYLKGEFIINDLTLAEFFWVLLRDYGQEDAETWFKKLESYSVTVNKEILIEAMKFRYNHRRSDISFYDAVGYVFSIENGYKFVTGDKEFKNLPNVEFKQK